MDKPYWITMKDLVVECKSMVARNEAGALYYSYEDMKNMKNMKEMKDTKTFKQAYEQAKSEGLDKFIFEGVIIDAKLTEQEAFKQFRNVK